MRFVFYMSMRHIVASFSLVPVYVPLQGDRNSLPFWTVREAHRGGTEFTRPLFVLAGKSVVGYDRSQPRQDFETGKCFVARYKATNIPSRTGAQRSGHPLSMASSNLGGGDRRDDRREPARSRFRRFRSGFEKNLGESCIFRLLGRFRLMKITPVNLPTSSLPPEGTLRSPLNRCETRVIRFVLVLFSSA